MCADIQVSIKIENISYINTKNWISVSDGKEIGTVCWFHYKGGLLTHIYETKNGLKHGKFYGYNLYSEICHSLNYKNNVCYGRKISVNF
jgi:hypothetical protein